MIEIEINDEAVTLALRRAHEKLADMTPLMWSIAELLAASTKDRIGAGGPSPGGAPWAPKSPVTIERQKRSNEGHDPRPLNWRGTLRRQIHYSADREQARVTSDRPYAATMQFGAAQGAFGATSRGGPIPWGDIPARPFLGMSGDDREAVLDIVESHLDPAS